MKKPVQIEFERPASLQREKASLQDELEKHSSKNCNAPLSKEKLLETIKSTLSAIVPVKSSTFSQKWRMTDELVEQGELKAESKQVPSASSAGDQDSASQGTAVSAVDDAHQASPSLSAESVTTSRKRKQDSLSCGNTDSQNSQKAGKPTTKHVDPAAGKVGTSKRRAHKKNPAGASIFSLVKKALGKPKLKVFKALVLGLKKHKTREDWKLSISKFGGSSAAGRSSTARSIT